VSIEWRSLCAVVADSFFDLSMCEREVKHLNWERKCLEEEMEQVQTDVSRAKVSIWNMDYFLRGRGIAREVNIRPPAFVQDLLDHLVRQDESGWVKQRGKRAKAGASVKPQRSTFGMWIRGDDLEVFAAMSQLQVQTASRKPTISVSVEGLPQSARNGPRKAVTAKRARAVDPASKNARDSDVQRRFVNSFTYLAADDTFAMTATPEDGSSDSDNSEVVGSDDSDDSDTEDTGVIESVPDRAGAEFQDPAVFLTKYGRAITVPRSDVRPIQLLKEDRDYWSMNRKERQKLYDFWQQTLLDEEADRSSKQFARLKKEHAQKLAEMEEYRNRVRTPPRRSTIILIPASARATVPAEAFEELRYRWSHNHWCREGGQLAQGKSSRADMSHRRLTG
jgi:hypothetical protein